jgi:hypothetical protein
LRFVRGEGEVGEKTMFQLKDHDHHPSTTAYQPEYERPSREFSSEISQVAIDSQ